MRNTALSMVSALVILFILEMTLRATEAVPYRTLLLANQAHGDAVPGPFLPGQALTIRTEPRLPYRVSINRLGFRGQDVDRSKPDGTIRIAALGGSHTFGLYVDGDETWPARLETHLRGDHPDLGIEVVNAGVEGLGLTGTATLLRNGILELEPDLVIFGHSLDTILVQESPAMAHESHDRFLSPIRQTATFHMARMMASYILREDRSNRSATAATIRLGERPDGPAASRLLSLYRARLEEIKTLLDDEGIPCFVLLFPTREQVAQGAGDGLRRRLATIHREIEIPVVDLLPAYRHYDRNASNYFLKLASELPSPRGYRRGARELMKALQPLLLGWEEAGPAAAAHASTGGSR